MAALVLGTISLPSSGVASSSAVKIKPFLFTKKSQTSARRGQITISASYQVTLITPEGEKANHFDPSDECTLDAAERQGVALPHNCRSGACSSCVGLLKSGTVRQDDQTFLDEAQLEAGFALMCSALPTSDCVIETHKEEQFY